MKKTLLVLLSLTCALGANEEYGCEPSRFYIGAFGGGLYSNSSRATQMGTAFFEEAVGGPLAVLAEGRTKSASTGFGGLQVGYEMAPIYTQFSNWTIAPAGELEAYFFGHKKKGHLFAESDRLPEHDFLDSFRMNMDSILVNAVFAVNSCLLGDFSPYIGGGIGATHISIRDAKSLQLDPVELGINHFNSRRNDTTWAFTGQIKAGIRYSIFRSLHLFAEYRYVYIDSSNYIFGSTVYTTHVPTSPWNVKLDNIQYNAFTVGFQLDL